jgi:hypothetical protein
LTHALLLLAAAAHAASYDPDLTWRTISTEHFHIHFHQGEEQLADELSVTLEEVWTTMTVEVGWEPRRRTEIVLVDRTDVANGYASAVPYNTVVMFVTAPTESSTLALYEDWNTALATHEFAHILHLDTNHGVVRAARAVVGRIASTNELSPPWMIEGFATFQETRQSAGGRGRSPTVDMIERTAVLADAFPPLGNLDGFQIDPPSGNLRYLFGEDFIAYVADHAGERVWTDWVHTYGSSIPYLLPSKRVFGRTLQRWYEDWKVDTIARYTAQADTIRAEGVREGGLISDPAASCSAPLFSPNGERLVWSCYDLQTGSALWMSDGRGGDPRVVKQDYGASGFTWRNDSKALLFASTHLVNRFNTWSDVYLMTVPGFVVSALTSGARARDPELSPDGQRLVVVTNRAQDTQLELITVDKQQRALTARDDHSQFSTPRFSPDGRTLAVSVWQHGRRDLWLYGDDGSPLQRLTADAANDREPRWSADGRWLLFVSDRSGVPNVYAVEIATERLFQVTNTLTGASAPTLTPDGALLAYQQYAQDGWQIRIMPFDPSNFLDRGLLPAVPAAGTAAWSDPAAPPPLARVGPPSAPTGAPTGASFEPGPEVRLRPLPPAAAPLAATRHHAALLAAPQSTEVLDTFDQTEVEDVFGDERDYPFRIEPHRYRPWSTLLPRFWLPFVRTTPYPPTVLTQSPWALEATALAFSSDTLRHVLWSATGSYRTDANFFGWSADVTWNRYLPVFSVGASRQAVPYTQYLWPDDVDADGVADDDEIAVAEDLYWQARTRAYLFVSYPYTFRSSLFAQYSITRRDTWSALDPDAYLPYLPVKGWFGGIQGGWRYAWSEQTAAAISTEDGRVFSVVGGVFQPWLGSFVQNADGTDSPLAQYTATVDLREYVVMPWSANHVLAARGGVGATFGATDYLGYYQLGGAFGDSTSYVVPDEFRLLRGYPLAADSGDRYWVAGAEYRMPLWRIDRGVGTVPAFARVVSAAAFVDAGNAFSSADPWSAAIVDPLVGVGAEVRGSVILGWSTSLTGRLGYAVGLTEGGFGPASLAAWYFQLGSSF